MNTSPDSINQVCPKPRSRCGARLGVSAPRAGWRPCRSEAILQRDSEISRWFKHHYQAAVRTAAHWGLRDAEDAVQESAIRAAELFRPDVEEFEILVGRLLRQRIFGAGRSREVEWLPLDAAIEATVEISEGDTNDVARAVLFSLPPNLQELLLLHLGYGICLEELATEKRTTVADLKRALAQAKRWLNVILHWFGNRSGTGRSLATRVCGGICSREAKGRGAQ